MLIHPGPVLCRFFRNLGLHPHLWRLQPRHIPRLHSTPHSVPPPALLPAPLLPLSARLDSGSHSPSRADHGHNLLQPHLLLPIPPHLPNHNTPELPPLQHLSLKPRLPRPPPALPTPPRLAPPPPRPRPPLTTYNARLTASSPHHSSRERHAPPLGHPPPRSPIPAPRSPALPFLNPPPEVETPHPILARDMDRVQPRLRGADGGVPPRRGNPHADLGGQATPYPRPGGNADEPDGGALVADVLPPNLSAGP